MNKTDEYKTWAESLSREQLVQAVVDLLGYLQDGEDFRFGDTGNPYWIADGEPLVAGQICFRED